MTYSGHVYFWGNYKYFCDGKSNKDIESPHCIANIDNIKDIACSYKYCAILNDKGEIYNWGHYISEKLKKKKMQLEY